MTHQLIKIKPIIVTIPKELWGTIIALSINDIKEFVELSLLSKQLREIIFTKKHLSLLLHRNFYALFSKWLFHLTSDRDDQIVASIVGKFISFMSNYNYCISGGFALATILGVRDFFGTRCDNDPCADCHWRGSDLDIYISLSKARYSRDEFCQQVSNWWEEVKHFFSRSRFEVHSEPKLQSYGHWCPKVTKKFFIVDVVDFKLSLEWRQREFQFIILDARHHITPTLFCKSKFDFNFLCNWIRFIRDGTSCQAHIEDLHAVITKSGSYTPFFVGEWKEQWRHWQLAKHSDDRVLQSDHRKQRMKMIPRVQERKKKYVARGFTITGDIPRTRFYFDKSPLR